MELKIIEPIQHYSKEFNSVDEFNLWYSKNKALVDEMTTHKLNKLYHIDGYRITRIKNVLMLKKYDKNKLNVEDLQEQSLTMSNEIENMKNDISEIKETINKIILFLRPSENTQEKELI